MITLNGKSISKGIAIGKIFFYEKDNREIKKQEITDTEHEITCYEAAKEKAIQMLSEVYEKTVKEAGEENAEIFQVHAMLLEDEDYNDFVYDLIRREHVNGEYAVFAAGEHFANMFLEMEDAYFKARSIDMKDISQRVIDILKGKEEEIYIGSEPVIMVAEDLTPSETVKIKKEQLLAFITKIGSANSHTAILARAMNIPALAGIQVDASWNGKMAIADGETGTFYIEPEEALLLTYREKKKAQEQEMEQLLTLRGKEGVTKSGKAIKVYGNIGTADDVEFALEHDAAGIGLFRSEFLYLEKQDYPTEEEQFLAYRKVAEAMQGKEVIIRTLDIGADKQADYFKLEQEANPAMGYRAIRICLTRVDIFKTQLRAIYRASAYGTIAVMYPMIISVNEVRQIKKITEEVKQELRDAGIPFGTVKQGVMIETPAAVMISDELAKEVDFFSIGTNDLTQYTLAIDRQNEKLDSFYDAHHPAVLRMIQMVIENGHKEGCVVGICGELGADLTLTKTLVDMGIDEISVSPAAILPIKKKIMEID